ncbi:substrate-binding domain-containing protein [Frankia sp. QA3]|uniref:sugar ABC transporter substrate-binding protein n=1 Tax=Frankia sp. QA3 TaxID=710111 RepID=UPI0002F5CEB5|nr:substrate-binding domain-containing protein [Frankia sp. QA3]
MTVAVALTGCAEASSGGGSPNAARSSAPSGAALAKTEQFVAPYVRAPVWRGPATSPPVAQAKHIVYVNQLPTQPLFRAIGTAAKEAGRALGWNVTELDAATLNDLPEVFNRAIAQKPDGIVFSNLSANEYPTITAALAKSKIPTVVIGVLPNQVNSSYTHVVDLHYSLQGQLIGAAAVLDRKADAKLGVLGFAPGFDPSGEALIAGIKSFLASSGGGSVVATKTIDVATVTDPSAVGQSSVAFVQANPELNAFYVGYDGTSSTVVPALRQAGLLNRVDVLAYQGDAQQLGWVRDGGGQVADVAWSQAWATWAAFDDFNRIFNNVTPPADDGVPVRLFTKNYPPPAGSTTWSGDFAFRAKYKALWKMS